MTWPVSPPRFANDRWTQLLRTAPAVAGSLGATRLTMVTGSARELYGPIHWSEAGWWAGTSSLTTAAFAAAVGTPVAIRNEPEPVYLVASITKPLVALLALQLVEAGQLSLIDRVMDYLPTFGTRGKSGVTLNHLLTHTSGLPDMLPENLELRQAHAPLGEFVARTCEQPLAFFPGRGVQYQSMGFAVLGAILETVSGQPLTHLLHEQLLRPLGLADTRLGNPTEPLPVGANPVATAAAALDRSRIVAVQLPEEQRDGADWNWNSAYWQALGAPWGGLLSTGTDLSCLAQALLMIHAGRWDHEQGTVCSAETLRLASSNRLEPFRELPEVERRTRPWGYGWRLNWPGHSATFSDLLAPEVFGHWGATGCLLWIDPRREVFGLLLTDRPHDPDQSGHVRLSNLLAACWQ